MEVQIFVPKKSNMAVVKKEYPDIYADGDEKHGDLSYFVGKPDDEPYGRKFFTYHQAIECCGFVEGAIPGAECIIEGNGILAMEMMKRKEFHDFEASPQQKAAWKRRSNAYWNAFKRGQSKLLSKPTCRDAGAPIILCPPKTQTGETNSLMIQARMLDGFQALITDEVQRLEALRGNPSFPEARYGFYIRAIRKQAKNLLVSTEVGL